MTISACDVVEYVWGKLEPLGYSCNEEGYGEILEALSEVEFFRGDDGGRLITLVTEWMKSQGYVLTPDLDNEPECGDFVMNDGPGNNVWITIQNLQVHISTNDDGVLVEILPYPLGGDAFQESVGSTYAFWGEGGCVSADECTQLRVGDCDGCPYIEAFEKETA